MKEIPLTRGLVAIVDDEDYEIVSKFKWYADRKGYARRDVVVEGKKKTHFLHHTILAPGPGKLIDHINRNKQDNRRLNLRMATPGQSQANRDKQSNNTTGYKRVCFNRQRNKYQANICHMGKQRHLGLFSTPEEAYAAYVRASREIFGEFSSV